MAASRARPSFDARGKPPANPRIATRTRTRIGSIPVPANREKELAEHRHGSARGEPRAAHPNHRGRSEWEGEYLSMTGSVHDCASRLELICGIQGPSLRSINAVARSPHCLISHVNSSHERPCANLRLACSFLARCRITFTRETCDRVQLSL